MKGTYNNDGDRLFNRACSNKTRGKGFKLKEFEVQALYKEKRFYNETKHFLKDPNLNSLKLAKLKVLPARSLKLIWSFTSQGHHFYSINYILQIKQKSGLKY